MSVRFNDKNKIIIERGIIPPPFMLLFSYLFSFYYYYYLRTPLKAAYNIFLMTINYVLITKGLIKKISFFFWSLYQLFFMVFYSLSIMHIVILPHNTILCQYCSNCHLFYNFIFFLFYIFFHYLATRFTFINS